MSSSQTAVTLTTDSSTSSPSRASRHALAVIACGALATPVRHLVERRAWAVEVYPLPALLHNRPHLIAPRVEALASRLRGQGHRVVVAYADCGTYGALDEVCERSGLHRLAGEHCYDLFAGADALSVALLRRARHLPADGLPGDHVPLDRAQGARPRPPPRAVG